MSRQMKKLKKAAHDLQKILEEIEPYTKRPVVEEHKTRGRWVQGDSYDVDLMLRRKEVEPNNKTSASQD